MITICGDVHGKYNEYYSKVKNSEYSVQIGDFGFTKEWNKLNYSGLDSSKHKVLAGNHEPYDTAPDSPYYLGDFGNTSLNGIEFFYVRGGISIDRVYRVGDELSGSPKTWWSEEELNFTQMLACLREYERVKPDIVMSHVPAAQFTHKILGNKSDAILQKFKFHAGFRENHQLLGDELIKIHKPKIMISGHLHASFQGMVNDIYVVGLRELETFNLTVDTIHQLSAKGNGGKDFMPPRQVMSMENIKDGLGL